MNPATIIAIMEAAAKLAKIAVPLIEQGDAVFSTEDHAKLKAALDQLHAANEVIYDRVQFKLRGSPIG